MGDVEEVCDGFIVDVLMLSFFNVFDIYFLVIDISK